MLTGLDNKEWGSFSKLLGTTISCHFISITLMKSSIDSFTNLDSVDYGQIGIFSICPINFFMYSEVLGIGIFVIEPEKEIFPRLVFTFLLVLDLLEIAIMVKFLNNYFQNKTDYVWLFL